MSKALMTLCMKNLKLLLLEPYKDLVPTYVNDHIMQNYVLNEGIIENS